MEDVNAMFQSGAMLEVRITSHLTVSKGKSVCSCSVWLHTEVFWAVSPQRPCEVGLVVGFRKLQKVTTSPVSMLERCGGRGFHLLDDLTSISIEAYRRPQGQDRRCCINSGSLYEQQHPPWMNKRAPLKESQTSSTGKLSKEPDTVIFHSGKRSRKTQQQQQ